MPAYDRSARDTLRLPAQADPTTPPWAVFDPDWYRTRHPHDADAADDALLDAYLSDGQRRGHSPNPWFDEAWQRRAWVGIQHLIDAGEVESAFDAWCRGAHASRAPHWLFDPAGYRARYPVLTEETLAESGLVNLYDHYLRYGAAERRIGHALFDPSAWLAGAPPEEVDAATAMPFAHYLHTLGVAPERRPSALFDRDWYRGRYHEALRAVAEGRHRSLLEHYLCNDQPMDFDPSPWFSERYYLDQNPGLAAVIGPEGFRNGFAHFLAHGLREGRSPHPDLDLGWYAGLPVIRADLAAGRAENAFVHWITLGHPAGLPGQPPPEIRITEAQAALLHQRRAETLLPGYSRHRLDFTCGEDPDISVILTAGDRPAATMATLAALRAHFRGAIDLIVIDGREAAEGLDIETQVTGATVLRFGTALSQAATREAGLICARADTVVLLGDGVEPGHGAIEAARARLAGAGPGDTGLGDTGLGDAAPIGVVGGRLIRPHGVLLEAGGIVWRDGGLQPYGRDDPPDAPEALFVRDTDFCSSLFLVARREVLAALPDPAAGLGGTTHEDADLCLRVREAGFRVVHEPDAVAFLTLPSPGHEPGTAPPDGREAFVAAHPGTLAARPAFDPAALVSARSPVRDPIRVLFVEDTVPLRRIGSGFVRSNDVLRAMAAAGAGVTVFPMRASGFGLAVLRAEVPDTVEVMHTLSAADFPAFLAARPGYYDVVWVARTHNLDRIYDALANLAASADPPRIIIDTEAVAATREAEEAALAGRDFDRDAALRREFRNLGLAMHVLAVTEAEAALIREHYSGPVGVLGHALAPAPTPLGFGARTGLLFVGALHDESHPNYDGLVWFIDAVLPLIERELGWETRLTVAGHAAPGVDTERFRHHPRVTWRGAVTDLTPLFDSHRVFIAPTRFAAGLPYKVHEAASRGLPAVVTPTLARQLGWTEGGALAIADPANPEAFAARVLALHRDAALWNRQRDAALARVARELDPASFGRAVLDLLRPATNRSNILPFGLQIDTEQGSSKE